jgi:hypothetical protein
MRFWILDFGFWIFPYTPKQSVPTVSGEVEAAYEAKRLCRAKDSLFAYVNKKSIVHAGGRPALALKARF